MSAPINCFDHIVGITQSECECFGEIDNFDSLSGLYIDGLVELSDVFELIDCQNGSDVSEVIKKSFQEAKRDFMSDFNSNLLSYYRVKRKDFKGVIGRVNWKTEVNTQFGNIAGMRVACADVVGGSFKIKKIGMLFSQTGNVRVHIKNNLGEYLGFLDLPTLANTHKVSVVDLDFPIHSPYIENLEYFFYYETTPHNKPKNNEIKCSTCGAFRPKYNLDKPYFNSQTGGQYGWANWMMAGGFTQSLSTAIEEVDFRCMPRICGNQLYGMTLDVELGCNNNLVICNDDMDYSKPIPIATAHAIRYKTGAIILEKMLRSSMINRITMVNRDEKKDTLAFWSDKYWELLNYIIRELQFNDTDCLCPKPRFETGVRTIFT